jgi:hypothetical protein
VSSSTSIFPSTGGPDCRQDIGKRAVLRQEPGGTSRGCRREPGRRGVCGEDQDTDLRAGCLDLPGGFDAVGAGQPDVHQHSVGMAGDRQRDGFLGRSHRTHAIHVGLSVYRDLQRTGERLLVLDHQHPCHEAARLSSGPITGQLYRLVGADIFFFPCVVPGLCVLLALPS